MSSTSATGTHNASGTNQTSAAKSSSGNASRTEKSAQTPADLFASLLGLLSATSDARLLADGTEASGLDTAAGDETTDSDDATDLGNPLAALLSWPGAPVLKTELSQSDAANGKAAVVADTVASDPGATTGEAAESPGLATGSGSDGVDLQGMTMLDQPIEADAELQTSLEAANRSTDNHRSTAAGAARADAAAFASRPANWRSTTALAHSASSSANAAPASAPTLTNQIQMGQAAQVRVASDVGLPNTRSTLTLDERFSASGTGEGPTPFGGLGTQHSATSQGGSDQSAPGSGAFADALKTEHAETSEADSEFNLTPEPLAEELLPEEVALSPGQLRHASLRIGEGGEEAIDIQLALRGEQLNVDFRTDNPEARASLQQNASSSLADMLQRGGIQLGQVSVGAQNQGQDGQGKGNDRTSTVSSASRRPGPAGLERSEGDGLRAQPALRRQDGSRPLDLFV